MNYFISKSDFVGYVDLSQNVEDKYILPAIRMAQVMTIKSALCEPLYNQLYTEYSTGTLSYDNAALLEKVKETLIFAAYHRYLSTVQLKSTPFGFEKKKSEHSEIPSRSELGDLIVLAQNDMNYFLGELRKYLKDNENIYTLHRDHCGCGCGEDDDFGGFNITSS